MPAPSFAAARRAPSSHCTRVAVGGEGWSGVSVDTMMRSSSSAEMPARSRAGRAAAITRSEVVCSGDIQRRSRMPTLAWTQASVLSPSQPSISALVTIRSGT